MKMNIKSCWNDLYMNVVVVDCRGGLVFVIFDVLLMIKGCVVYWNILWFIDKN